jgi:hypothetical protein
MEISGHGLLESTVLSFKWMNWGKPRKTQAGYPVTRPCFDPRTSRIRDISADESTATLDLLEVKLNFNPREMRVFVSENCIC